MNEGTEEGASGFSIAEDGRVVVVAFDPGVSTGWAASCFDRVTLFDEEASLMKRLHTGEWRVGSIERSDVLVGLDWSGSLLAPEVRHRALQGFEGWDSYTARSMVEICRWWWTLQEVDPELDVFVVVQEDFILQTRDAARHTLAPVRVNAAFDVLMPSEPSKGLRKTKFLPSDAKNVVTDERLKRWRMYDLGGGVTHRRDAIRHNVLFLRKWSTEKWFRARFEI